VKWYAGLKRCSHKRGRAWRNCINAVTRAYAKPLPKLFAQRTAEHACTSMNGAGESQLNPEDPEYRQKQAQLAATLQDCMAKARA